MPVTCTMAMIRHAVSQETGVPEADLVSPRRDGETVLARFIAIWIAKRRLPYSLPQIGRHMGGRDHTTVLNALDRIEKLQADDPSVRQTIEAVEASLDIAEEALRIAALPVPPDPDPLEIATRALADPRVAVRLTIQEIRVLARSVVLADQERPEISVVEREVQVPVLPAEVGAALRRLRQARQAFEGAAGGRFESAARRDLLSAIDSADTAYQAARAGGPPTLPQTTTERASA